MSVWLVTAAAVWTVVVLLLGVLIGRGLRAGDRHEEAKRSPQRTASSGDLPRAPDRQPGFADTGQRSEGNGVQPPEAPPRPYARPPTSGPAT